MINEQIPAKQLWGATLAACVTGLVMLTVVIMPAEYNIDPTGLGSALGLTGLSPAMLNQSAGQPAGPAVLDMQTADPVANGTATLVLAAGSGREFKLEMTEGKQVDFEWNTDGVAVYVDMHGELFDDPSGYFKSYVVATAAEMKGSFMAAFAGKHGWYFRNDSQGEVTIRLSFSGQYDNPHAL